MKSTRLFVELISHTPLPQELIATSARLCYSPLSASELKQKADAPSFVDKLFDMGHLSPFEHASFTFAVEGVSRALLAQLSRHRIASFSVQSQRYVASADGFDYIIPPSIQALGEQAVATFETQMRAMHDFYNEWLAKVPAEDARFVLPNACETRLIFTMNARELLHFFSLRCCTRAQWEIRALAWAVLGLARKAAPAIFARGGPGCLSGACPEGKKTCGRADEIKRMSAQLDSAGDPLEWAIHTFLEGYDKH